MHGDERWDEIDDRPIAGTTLCEAAELADAVPVVVTLGGRRGAFEIIVVRDGDAVRAFLNRCAHLPLPLNIGSTVRVRDRHLLCDHHRAVYRIADGMCVDGSCPNAFLTVVPIAVCEGRVTIGEGDAGSS